MDRYIGLDAHASSCTLGVVGPSGKRLGSHVVETNARALIEVLRGIPKSRHMCLEEGTLSGWLHEVLEPHVEELVVTGVRKSRGLKSDKAGRVRARGAAQDRCDQDARVQGTGPVHEVGQSGEGLRLPGGRHRTGEEPAQERAALERRGVRGGTVGVREAREGAVAGQVAGGDEGAGPSTVRGARRAGGSTSEGRKDDAGRGTQAPGVARADDVAGSGPDPDRRTTARCGDAVPVQKPGADSGPTAAWAS